MALRTQPYRFTWPLNAAQVENLDTSIQILFKSIHTVDAFTSGGPTGLDEGAVIFSSGTALTGDAANLFWDDTNHRLGIGTATPQFAVDVTGNHPVFGGDNAVRITNVSTSANAGSLLDVLCGDVSTGSYVYARLQANSPSHASPIVSFGTGSAHELVLVTAGGERLRIAQGGVNTFVSFGQPTTSYPALRRAATVLETRLGDDSAYADFKASNLITNAMVKVGGTSGSFPGLKNNGAELQIRLADDSAFATMQSARLQVTANSADNKAIYLTGTINSQTPAMFYNDTTITGIGNTGTESAQGFYVGPSFSLGGNAANIEVMSLPITNVTLNGHTVTNATTLDVQGAPTNGTIRRAIWSHQGLNEFDGLVAFGGNTASFPALKNSGANLEARLADDSGYTLFHANNLQVEASGSITSTGRGLFGNVADAQWQITNNAGTTSGRFSTSTIDLSHQAAVNRFAANGSSRFYFGNEAQTTGFHLDGSTADVLQLQVHGSTAYGTLDCLGLKASGAAGASFGPAAVASITVVNGIVTAIS